MLSGISETEKDKYAVILLLWGFPGGLDGEESTCSTADLGSIPGLGRSPEEGNGNPFHCSSLGKPMDRGAGRLQSILCPVKELDMTEQLTLSLNG